VHCSKGTYIRSLAEDLGESLGSGAHVSRLRRVQSGPFSLDESVSLPVLESLQGSGDSSAMDALLLPSQRALLGMPKVTLSESAGFYLRQGQAVLVTRPEFDPIVHLLPTGAATWLAALETQPLGSAVEAATAAAPNFDLAASLTLALHARAFRAPEKEAQ
jgi:tRNA U55 pseudouridine synthase TruB